jgi:type I restriction enzyme S subunit
MAFTMTVAEVIAADTTGLLGKHSNWERVPLALVADILNGAPFDSALFNNSEGMPLARIRDVLTGDTSTYYTGTYEDTYIIRHGDLLVGMDGDFNSGFWGVRPALLNQRVCKITPIEQHYDKRLLSLALPGYLAAINANTPSVTVKHLSSKTIGEIELPLPPRAEQTRIVAKLEELLSDLDAGVAELKAAQKKLAQYRQSLLKAAVEGALTAQWRAAQKALHPEPVEGESGADLLARILTERRARWEAKQLAKFASQGKAAPKDWQKKYPEPIAPDTTDLPQLPQGWVWASLDALIDDGPQNGLYLPSSKYGSGTPILRIDDYQIGWHRDRAALNLVAASQIEVDTYAAASGEIVINRVNSMTHLGKSLLISEALSGVLFESNMMRLSLSAFVSGEIVAHYLGSDIGRARLIKDAKWAVNQASINQQDVRRTPVPLMPLAEQNAISQILSEQLKAAAEQESAITHSLHQSTAQRQNLLRAAFAGELVPQDPADEPASVLLDRIRAERALQAASKKAAPKKPRGRKAKEQA